MTIYTIVTEVNEENCGRVGESEELRSSRGGSSIFATDTPSSPGSIIKRKRLPPLNGSKRSFRNLRRSRSLLGLALVKFQACLSSSSVGAPEPSESGKFSPRLHTLHQESFFDRKQNTNSYSLFAVVLPPAISYVVCLALQM